MAMNKYPAMLLALLILLITQTAAAEWVLETFDLQEDRLFSFPRIVIDSQETSHVLYHDGTGWGIRYASNDGSGWQATIVDDVGMLTPFYDLAVSVDGTPYIGYRGATGHLEYAIRENGGWASAKIDSTGNTGRVAACIDADGMPLFAYVMDDAIRLAHWSGTAWENTAVCAVGDCAYLRMRLNPQNAPVIGAIDDDTNTVLVCTGNPDFSSWIVDDTLVPSSMENSYAFDLNSDGHPHWCYYNTTSLQVIIASNYGSGWTDVSVDTPTILIDSPFDFCFDRQDNPGLIISNQYGHHEGGDWVWRESIMPALAFGGSLDFNVNGNATIVTANMAMTWWSGQPELVLPETGHVWDEAYVPWDLVLQNTGDMPLVVDEIDYLSGDPAVFPLIGTTFPLTIQPDDSGMIRFDFQPPADGTYTAGVELSTNDPVAPSPLITLEGTYQSTQPGGTKPVLVTNVHADMLNKRLVEDIPLAGADVSLLQGAVTAYGPLTTSSEGTIIFTDITPGTYNVMAVGAYPDPEDPQITRRVTSYVRNIDIAEGLNPQAVVVLPDSLMQQAYRATYQVEGLGDSDLMEFDYPAAATARQVLGDLGQDMSSYEKIQSVSRLMLACDATGTMFHDASMVGDSFIGGLGSISTFLFYSNNWLNSIIDIIKIIAKAVTDKLGAMLDTIILVAKVILRFIVSGAVEYALSFLPCDETDLVCVRDVGKAAWNGLNEAFGGFGIAAFSFDEWDYFIEKAELLMMPALFQFAYIDNMTDPDLENAVERSADLDFISTFDYVAPKTYGDLEENAQLTDFTAEFCNDLLTAAQLMYATALVFDALENLPYLGILGTIGDIMNISAWVSLGTSLGTSGGIYFTQPMFLDDLVDDIYDPFDKSGRGSPPCPETGRPLAIETQTGLKTALKAAGDDYAAVIAEIRTSVQANDAESAALSLGDLAAADTRWLRQSELARKPVHAVAAQADVAHGEFAAQYDTLLARNTAVGAEHLKTYLGVLALSVDEKGDISDYILQQLDANVAANTAFSDHMGVILDTVADIPVPAILAAAEITQSAERLEAGRTDTLTVRLMNLGGMVATDIDLILGTSENLSVASTDSLHLASLATGAESADFMFLVEPAGTDTTDAVWTLHFSAANAEAQYESGLFLAPIGGITPETGNSLDSDNAYNYPNPFRPGMQSTTLRFSMAKTAKVTIRIYDNGNRLVKDLIHNIEYPGVQEIGVEWDGRNGQDDLVANGVYFAVIENSQGERAVCKIAVLR
jgi:hypothetical protein